MEQGRVDAAGVAGVAAAQAAIAARRRADVELHAVVAGLLADGAAAAAGFRSLPALLQDTLRVNQAEATRPVDRAERLTARTSMTGEPLDPELPAPAPACAAGVARDGRVTVIVETLEHLRRVPGLDSEALAAADSDVGRLSYTVAEGMRRALHLRDGGCSFPGCTRRPRRCHAHHVRHRADGGATELDNLTLLCSRHHHLIHHSAWTVSMIHGRPWFRPPTWIDPQQEPRPGGRCPVLRASRGGERARRTGGHPPAIRTGPG